MTVLRRRDLLAGLLAFPLFVTSVAKAQVGSGPRGFDFETKLWAPAFANKMKELPRGALLRPLRSGSSEDEYQPIVICDDLVLHFDQAGFSRKPVHVRGFCRVAGFKAVVGTPEDFVWEVTAAVDPDIRRVGCDPALLKAKREKQMRPKGPWGDLGPAKWAKVHDKPYQECLSLLVKDVKELGVDLQTLTRKQVCVLTTPTLDDETGEWVNCRLDCWPKLLESR